MASPTKRFNIAAGKPYTTSGGETKKQWINFGRATQWDDGTISLELHAVPVGAWFDGKAYLFEDDGQRSQGGTQQQPQRAPQRQQQPVDDPGIPF